MTRRVKRTRHSVIPLAGLAVVLGGSLIYNYQFAHGGPAAPILAPAASVTSLDVHVTTRQTSYRSSVTSPAFSTSQPNETLLALLASDGPAKGTIRFSSVTGGGLTWHLVSRSSASPGDAEIWAAQTTTRLTGVRIRATRNSGAYHGLLTIISIPAAGQLLSIATAGSAGAQSGQPSLTLRDVPAGSGVYAVGNDWDRAVGRQVGAGETLVSQSVDTQVADTYWTQRLSAPSASPSVTVTDSAPTGDEWNVAAVDQWNLAAVAVDATGPASSTGSVPSSPGKTGGAPVLGDTPSPTPSASSQPTQSDTPQPPPASSSAPAPSPSTSTPGATPSATGNSGGTSYVQPGTQGYRGAISGLTVYSAANGQVPAAGCSWVAGSGETAKYLQCEGTNLNLDHANIQGSLEWDGCGSLTIANSILDWQASSYWFSTYAACAAPDRGATVTVTNSTFGTADDIPYAGLSDTGALDVRSDSTPMFVSNSLFKDFPQGIDPNGGSVIKDNEIYASDLTCWLNSAAGTTGPCHDDGLFAQADSNMTYEGNYVSVPADSTAAIFFQSSPHSAGNTVIGNFLKGGSFTLYNEDSDGLNVENNTFGGYHYGDVELCSGSWNTWKGNVRSDGSAVAAPGSTCSY
jgi:hypothetical protein